MIFGQKQWYELHNIVIMKKCESKEGCLSFLDKKKVYFLC